MSSFPEPILFFIPFAGGHEGCYRALERLLAPWMECRTMELPGRGRRFSEPLLTSVAQMAEDVLARIKPLICSRPFALFGHSLGALIAFEVAVRLASSVRPPMHLFISGCASPTATRESENWRSLPSTAFRNELAKLGGLPAEILNDHEAMDIFEPILRADIAAKETYESHARRLHVPLTVFYGTADELSGETVEDWRATTTADFRSAAFSGGHFFIFSHADEIAASIKERFSAH
jgi:surfactin synthase thioesterase subunit